MAIIPAEEKVFMVSNSTNTTYSGSAALKAMQQWYTMGDVTNTVRPYQVFTALLTQSGWDDFAVLNSGDLTIGVTYLIQLLEGADFSNVGGNNVEGGYFIATGTTPNSWGTGGQLEYNTGAPVATVLENTIGNVWFSYNDIGKYNADSSELFISNKTIFNGITYYDENNGNGIIDCMSDIENNTSSTISIWAFARDYYSFLDGALNNAPIEIRVYN
jgi:hypothetical protein